MSEGRWEIECNRLEFRIVELEKVLTEVEECAEDRQRLIVQMSKEALSERDTLRGLLREALDTASLNSDLYRRITAVLKENGN